MKNTVLYKSFKQINKKFSKQILADLLFYLAVMALVVGVMLLLKENISRLSSTIPVLEEMQGYISGNFEKLPPKALVEQLTDVKSLFINVLSQATILVAIASAVIIFLSTMLKGLIWNNIKGESSD